MPSSGLITLVVIVVFVVVMFYWLFSTADYGHLCSPSCGEIHNISYPFGLKGERQFNLKSGKGKPKESFERKVKGLNTFLVLEFWKFYFLVLTEFQFVSQMVPGF